MLVSGDYSETRIGLHELGYLLFSQRETMMMRRHTYIYIYIYMKEDILHFIKTTHDSITILQPASESYLC
jgi:hypothetical protein